MKQICVMSKPEILFRQ